MKHIQSVEAVANKLWKPCLSLRFRLYKTAERTSSPSCPTWTGPLNLPKETWLQSQAVQHLALNPVPRTAVHTNSAFSVSPTLPVNNESFRQPVIFASTVTPRQGARAGQSWMSQACHGGPVLGSPCRNQRSITHLASVGEQDEGRPSLSAEAHVGQASPAGSSSQHRRSSRRGSVDLKEVAKFAAIADQWWDPRGLHRGLHAMNPTRISFLRSAICRHFGKDPSEARPLQGLRVLDVGCGGGLLCEPLARMGAQVTGLDATERNISVAAVHAARDPATAGITYLCSTAEQLAEEGRSFDVVVSLEVIEHVAEPLGFMESLGALCRPGGAMVVSTLNRTLRSYALAIGVAEYALAWLPQGTHEWSRFVTPQEMAVLMRRGGLQMNEVAGMVYNPLAQTWNLSGDTTVNYIAFATRPGAG